MTWKSLENQYNIEGIVKLLAIPICVLLVLVGIVKLIDIINERKRTERHELMTDAAVLDVCPTKERLSVIINHKQFTKTSKTFQSAVHEKLAAYDMVPSAIEKTMSSVQLYEANSPLWTNGLSIEAIDSFYHLVALLKAIDIWPDSYLEAYVRDCKNGVSPEIASNKQLQKCGFY